MEDHSRGVPHQHIGNFTGQDAGACGEEGNIFFLFRGAAVLTAIAIVGGTAVIGFHQQQGVFQSAQLFQSRNDPPHIAVAVFNGSKMLRCAVAMPMAGTVRTVKMEKQQCRIVILQMGDYRIDQLRIFGMVLIYAQSVFDDTDVDGIPVAEGGQVRLRHGVPDDTKNGRVYAVLGIGPHIGNGIGQAVPSAWHTVEHGTPALGADGGNLRQYPAADGTIAEDLVQIGGICLFKKSACPIDAEEDDPLDFVHGFSSFGANIIGEGQAPPLWILITASFLPGYS